jgi:thioredoxin-like negative regulator of GroEL
MKFQLPPRRLIPKWRPVASTLKNAESQPSIEHKPSEFNGNAEEFEKAVALWRQTMEPGVLGDVLSFSVHPDLQSKAIDIGREAVRVGAKVTTAQASLIQDAIDDPMAAQLENMPFQKPIQELRNTLRNTPDNPLALLDYAQFQLALGKEKAAERSLKTALSLVPNNRLVLRTMARFLVHSNEASRAHSLIQRHPCTPYDPW